MRFFLLTVFTSTILLHSGFTNRLAAQETQNYQAVCIGFYNLENLFDTLDTEHVNDEEFTPEGDKRWGGERYAHKLTNLAEVISQIGQPVQPDGAAILGVSEVENKEVLEDLVQTEALKDRNYNIVHYHSPDRRGIDVALLYQPKYFKVLSSRSLRLVYPEDTSLRTRDQLLVTGELAGERIHVMVAHWPSRRGGQKRSEPLRIAAAQLGRSVIDSIRAVEPDAKIFYMGDLNDDPVNNSVKKVMRATGDPLAAQGKRLYNPMLELYRKGIGTLAWRDNWSLFDQILLSPKLMETDDDDWRYYVAKVFNKPFLRQSEGQFQGYPFRTYVGSNWMGGYSDHFPVYVLLVRAAPE